MIALDDPQHGPGRGYRAGCHERCCLGAVALYERRRSKRKAMGHDRRIDPTGTKRRIRALQALGWTLDHAAAAGGFANSGSLNKMLRDSGSWVFVSRAQRAQLAYDRLSMEVGPSRLAAQYAARQGWPPPLAWDDETIDDPATRPYRPNSGSRSATASSSTRSSCSVRSPASGSPPGRMSGSSSSAGGRPRAAPWPSWTSCRAGASTAT